MIHFDQCIKYQYRDTILNQVSVSVSRYNLQVSYPTLRISNLRTNKMDCIRWRAICLR